MALIQESRTTKEDDKERIREVSKKIKKCIRDKKRSERQQKIQKLLEEMRGTKNIANIKSAKRRILIPKIKTMKGEAITSRRGIADVFDEFYGKLYDGDCGNKAGTEADESKKKRRKKLKLKEMKSRKEFQSSQKKRCKQPSIVSFLAKQETATESELKTSKDATRRRKSG